MRRAVWAGIAVALGALLASTPAFAAGVSVKVSAPSSVNYGSSITFTISGNAPRPTGKKRSYPPNFVGVTGLTSPTAKCPTKAGGSRNDLESVVRFHSKRPSLPLKHFSRTFTVKPSTQAYGLCVSLVNFPVGIQYAHAAAYWKVNGSAPTSYTLTATIAGSDGQVSSVDLNSPNAPNLLCDPLQGFDTCSVNEPPGDEISLEADSPNTFVGWSGACSGTDPTNCDITMNGNKSVTATFGAPAP